MSNISLSSVAAADSNGSVSSDLQIKISININ